MRPQSEEVQVLKKGTVAATKTVKKTTCATSRHVPRCLPLHPARCGARFGASGEQPRATCLRTGFEELQTFWAQSVGRKIGTTESYTEGRSRQGAAHKEWRLLDTQLYQKKGLLLHRFKKTVWRHRAKNKSATRTLTRHNHP